VPFDHLKRRFNDFKQGAFWVGQEAENDFKVSIDNCKHRFFNFTKDALFAGQETQNKLKMTNESMKHCYLDLILISFCCRFSV